MPSFRNEIRDAVADAEPIRVVDFSFLEGPRAQKLARFLRVSLQAPSKSLRWRFAVWKLNASSWLLDTESFDVEPMRELCLEVVRQRVSDERLNNLSRILVGKGLTPVPKLLFATISQAARDNARTISIDFADPIAISYDGVFAMGVPATLARAFRGACEFALAIGFETYADIAADPSLPVRALFRWESEDRFVVELG